MVDENQNGTPIDPTNVTVKRKRGRPRKDDVTASESVKKRPYRRAEQSVQFGDVSVGQTVTGVLDGKFDAGYMLTVTVGNSGTVLTGVVFEQGRSVPVSAANDIAPNVEMLNRVEVPIPSSRHQSQHMLKRDDSVVHSMESSRLMPDAFNEKKTPETLVQNTIIQTDRVPVSSSAHSILHSDPTPKVPSSVYTSDRQANQNVASAPQSSASEPMEIKVTSDKEPVNTKCTTKNSLTDTTHTLPSASEPMKTRIIETPNNKTVETPSDKTIEVPNDRPVPTKELPAHPTVIPQLAPEKNIIDTSSDKTMKTPNVKFMEAPNDELVATKEPSVHPTITQLAAIHDPQHENERTLNLLGRKSSYPETAEASVESFTAKCTDDYLSRGLSAEVRSPVEQNTDTSLDSRSQQKIQRQAPELNFQTSLFTPASERPHVGGTTPSSDVRQTSDVTEASKDAESQAAAGYSK